jgi:hypothetical protein
MTADEVIAQFFGPLYGLPCWGLNNGFSSWLTFQFGSPRLSIREPVPDSEHAIMRMRDVRIDGEHQLWIEMGDWLIFQDGARLANSESDAATISKATAYLDGQALIGLRTGVSGMSEFTFDLGGRLWLSRYEDWEPDHGLWHMTAGDSIISFHADGRITTDVPQGGQRVERDYGFVIGSSDT